MAFSSIIMLPLLLLFLAIWAGLIYLLILLIRGFAEVPAGRGGPPGKSGDLPYPGGGPQGPPDALPDDPGVVAEALGVSRQAVSKWETGTADPSTSNPAGPGEALRCASGGAAAGDRRPAEQGRERPHELCYHL